MKKNDPSMLENAMEVRVLKRHNFVCWWCSSSKVFCTISILLSTALCYTNPKRSSLKHSRNKRERTCVICMEQSIFYGFSVGFSLSLSYLVQMPSLYNASDFSSKDMAVIQRTFDSLYQFLSDNPGYFLRPDGYIDRESDSSDTK